MLNSVSLMGRIVADPQMQFEKEGKEAAAARYRLAVERDYKVKGQPTVDYILCKAFGPNANYAKAYFQKGNLVVVSGRIATESYGNDEEKHYITLIYIEKNYLAKKREWCSV